MAAMIVGAVAIVAGIIAMAVPASWSAPPSACPRGLSADRTHPYCPCALHQGAVKYGKLHL